jgi:hypothetical protein
MSPQVQVGEVVGLTVEQAMQAFDALSHATHHLCDRDRMNAHIHLAEPRWSPLTELVSDAATMLQEVLQDQAIIGAPIQHQAHQP